MAQYEKIKVRSKSGLLVTKWKDKKTGRVYTTKPSTNRDKLTGKVGVGDAKKLKEIQSKNRQKLKPYLGLRNTNIGVGGDLKKQIRDTKTPNEKDATEGSNKQKIDVTSKAYKAAVKSGSPDTTEGGSRKEIDPTSPQFKEAVTNPKKFLKKAEKDNKPQNKDKLKAKDTGGTSDSDKAAWLERTRNSPAAKSKAWKNDPEGRWAIQKGVRERKATKLKIKQDKNKKNGG